MKAYTIRNARLSDAKELLSMMRVVLQESPWLVSEADELPRNSSFERKFVEGHIKQKNSQLLVAVVPEGCIIGSLGLDGGAKRRNKHLATFGVVVLKEWRGKGVGLALMKAMIKGAKKGGIEKIKLSVNANNRTAISLYSKLGFVVEGHFKKEIKVGKKYFDTLEMAKFI